MGFFARRRGMGAKHSGAALSSNREFVSYGDVIYALYGTILLKAEVSGAVQDFSAVKDAPAAARLGIIKDFLVLGKLSGQGNAIRWSGIDDPDAWPAPGSNDAQYKQSDIQIFPVGGNVQAIVGGVGGVDGLIFMEEAVHRATFVGPPYVFQFNVVDRRRGALASHSPIVCETTCIYLASDGWYATDGASVRAIGAERIDQWFSILAIWTGLKKSAEYGTRKTAWHSGLSRTTGARIIFTIGFSSTTISSTNGHMRS